MKDVFLDVRLELDHAALSREPNPDQFVINTARAEAEALCERSRARLRTDRAPEIIITQGENKVTGQLCLLVATRWAVVAPEDVPLGPPK